MTNPSPSAQSILSNQVLLAVRLGWLTVETFGRLRRYARLGYRLEEIPGDANRRFSFSDRSLSQRNEFFFAVDQLHRTATRLDPDLSSCPLPTHEQLDQLLSGGLDLDACQSQLDHWSTQVWGALSTEDELTGRGFTYGGSLADTFWHTDVLGPDRFVELLRPQRLEYLAARFDSIAEHLPPYVARILHYTLYKWRDQGHASDKLDATGKKRTLKRLESQAKVWHDLLFGSRNAESYLLTTDDRLITAGTMGATFLLALVVVVGVWLLTLTMSTVGRTLTAEITGLSTQLPEAQSAFLDDLLNWQMWSTMVATLSSVVVLVSGLVTSLSGWVIWVYQRLKEWLKLQFIYQRTYRR